MHQPLITPLEATRIIANYRWSGEPAERIDVLQSMGRITASDWLTDRDQPPFHRIMMDGIAIRYADFEAGQREWVIDGLQAAGDPLRKVTVSTEAVEIMTGAMLVDGLDTVIPYEQLAITQGRAQFIGEEVKAIQHVHPQGSDKRVGDCVLAKGSRIGPTEIGIAASIGMTHIEVQRVPRIAIVSTGNELVEISALPLPHQIRMSNVHALSAACFACTGQWPATRHANDTAEDLRRILSELIATCDLVMLSGGVSMGKLDYVPQVVQELGALVHFHGVAQRPGKPLLFATTPSCRLFGLPGNPVSTLVGWARYVRPWICDEGSVELTCDASRYKTFKWSQFIPVRAQGEDIIPLPMNGSGDFMALAGASGFIEMLPQDIQKHHAFWRI